MLLGYWEERRLRRNYVIKIIEVIYASRIKNDRINKKWKGRVSLLIRVQSDSVLEIPLKNKG